jgi:uncharacterized protein YdaU (DUF1376 family)
MKAPAFQFYAGDFLSSPDVSIMNTQEVGAYCLLLFNAWQSDKPGYLLNDERRLQRFTRLSNTEWADCREAVLAKFPVTDDGLYRFNPRMVMEASKQQMRRIKLAENGRKGGRPKQDDAAPNNQLLSTENQLLSQDNQKLSVENQKQSLSSSSSTTKEQSSEGESERESVTDAATAALPDFEKIDSCRSESELLEFWKGLDPRPAMGSAIQLRIAERKAFLDTAMLGAVAPAPASSSKRKPGEIHPQVLALPMPYPSEAFRKEWLELLNSTGKQRNKSVSAHRKVLEQLADLNSETIAILALAEAIAGGYQGVVFDRHREKAEKLHNGGMIASVNPLAIPQSPDAYRHEVNPEIQAKWDADEQERRAQKMAERAAKYRAEQSA